jgi:cytochrome c556
MTQKLIRTGLFAATLTAFILATGGLTAQDEKTPTIKEIMKKGHGSKGLLTGIAQSARSGAWDDAINDAKLLKSFGEGLGKNMPPRGDSVSWKKLTTKYKENTEAVAKSAEKKDAKGVTAALNKINPKSGSCKECHDSHKGK